MLTDKVELLKQAVTYYEDLIAELKQTQKDLQEDIKARDDSLDLQDHSVVDELSSNVERENQQISHAQYELQRLHEVHKNQKLEAIDFGAVVKTDNLNFFIAVPISRMECEGKRYVGISVDAPIYKVMKGKKKGESFEFNSQAYHIQDIS